MYVYPSLAPIPILTCRSYEVSRPEGWSVQIMGIFMLIPKDEDPEPIVSRSTILTHSSNESYV